VRACDAVHEFDAECIDRTPENLAPSKAARASGETQHEILGDIAHGDDRDPGSAIRQVFDDAMPVAVIVAGVDGRTGLPFDPDMISTLVCHDVFRALKRSYALAKQSRNR
jgi:hypothetical protein